MRRSCSGTCAFLHLICLLWMFSATFASETRSSGLFWHSISATPLRFTLHRTYAAARGRSPEPKHTGIEAHQMLPMAQVRAL